MEIFDLIIIGSGPAGLAAAFSARRNGLTCLIAEKNLIGGTCLNDGCIPSKSMLRSASKLGKSEPLELEKANLRKQATIERLRDSLTLRLEECGAQVVFGEAVVCGKADGNFKVQIGEKEFFSKNVLIACGVGSPVNENGDFTDSSAVWRITQVPESCAVIGAGISGLEAASFLASIGSKVTIFEKLEQICFFDSDLTNALLNSMKKRKIRFEFGAVHPDLSEFNCVFDCSGVHSACLINLKSLGIDDTGTIKTDEGMRTCVQGLYAAGDICGGITAANIAAEQGETAVESILGRERKARTDICASALFTNPEVAFVGMSLAEACRSGIEAYESTVPMSMSGSYFALSENGFVKIIRRKDNGQIIGGAVFGENASELISTLSLMIVNSMTCEDISKSYFPHPTLSELFGEFD